MRLADFIQANVEPILVEWESFARGIWPGDAADPATLRDHAEDVLRATVFDMGSDQTSAQQSVKSKGRGVGGAGSHGVDAASKLHGADRAGRGFDLAELVAEYRALRASVLRLWENSLPSASASDLKDLTRFNEAIDQSLTEAVCSFSDHHRKCQDALVAEKAARLGAENANHAKDTFLGTLSHEMRTPLNAIVGWLSILRDKRRSMEDLEEGLEVIERNTKAQVRLIEDVLDVSRIVSGKLRLETGLCNLTEIIAASVEAFRAAASSQGITLDVQLSSTDNPATCDPGRIQQIVWNLVSNAVKFTPRGGTVAVSLAREHANARIQVKDTGRGIPPAFLPHVFDRFRQADDGTRRKSGGLGLGLSIVKHLVELHGGTIEAQSAGEGRGSTFTVRLPVYKASVAEVEHHPPATLEQGTASASPALVRLDGLRVMVVEDEPDALRILVKLLESVGSQVIAASSVREALEGLDASQPGVLVSDIGMPDQDGYDLIREIRRRGHHARDLPAIALTAFVHKDDQRKAVMAGFQVHVPKPVDPYDLTATIASLAGRTGC